MSDSLIGPVLTIGYHQGDCEGPSDEHDYDILSMQKTKLGYFLGLARLSDCDGFKQKLRHEELILKEGCSIDKDTRVRGSGGVEWTHPKFFDGLAACYRLLLQANREKGIEKPQRKGMIEESAEIEGIFSGVSGILGMFWGEDYDIYWKFKKPEGKIPQFERKIGLFLANRGPHALTPTQTQAIEQLWQGMKTENEEGRGLILDWEKIPVDRPMNEDEMDARGANLHEFARLTHYLDAAIIDKPVSEVFAKTEASPKGPSQQLEFNLQ